LEFDFPMAGLDHYLVQLHDELHPDRVLPGGLAPLQFQLVAPHCHHLVHHK